MIKYLLLIIISIPVIGLADCDEKLVDAVRGKLGYIEERDEYSEFIDCKKTPNNPRNSIIAIAKRKAGTEINDSPTMGDYNLDIVIANTSSGKIAHHHFHDSRFISDGFRLGGLSIDTGKYYISPGVRAFGIRTSHHIDAGFMSSQALSLYVLDKGNIREVLSDADLYIGYWMKATIDQTMKREANRVVEISKSLTNGFYDLQITESLVDSIEKDNELETKQDIINTEIKKYKLQFNKKSRSYLIPNEMREFDCKVC